MDLYAVVRSGLITPRYEATFSNEFEAQVWARARGPIHKWVRINPDYTPSEELMRMVNAERKRLKLNPIEFKGWGVK